MIVLQKLKWGYFFSYGDCNEIDFTENTVTQILGDNGNGKSSIPLILEETIFNKNSKGFKKADIPNRYSDKPCWSELDFMKDGDKYFIRQERKTVVKVKLMKNGEDISSHTSTNTFKTIEQLFGNDFKIFSQLLYQNMHNSLQFLTATDTTRKKFLMDLWHLDEYTEHFERFKSITKTQTSTVLKLQAQVETIETWIKNNQIEDLEEKPVVEISSLDLFSIEREYNEKGIELRNIKNNNNIIQRNNKLIESLDFVDLSELDEITVTESVSYDPLQTELGGLQISKSKAMTAKNKIERLGLHCPTCEQSINQEFKTRLIKEEEDEIETIEKRMAILATEINSIKFTNERLKYKQKCLQEYEDLKASVNWELPKELSNKSDIEADLSDLAIRISNAKENIKSLEAVNRSAMKHNSKIAIFLEQSEKFTKQLIETSKSLENERAILSSLEILKKAFGPSGLPAYKIENLVKELERETNDYLANMSDGRFAIEFNLVSDKLNVNINDHGNVVEITVLSSGELARVNISTLLALRKLMNNISASKINVLFLDEVINVLDEHGREKLVEVLLEEDLNTFIVSHGWTHPLLAKLEVIKENEISRIERA